MPDLYDLIGQFTLPVESLAVQPPTNGGCGNLECIGFTAVG